MNAKDFQLDYFQIYDIENPKVISHYSPSVRLTGQFGKESEWVTPYALKKFANPVSKNGEPIFDRNAHLTWYTLFSSDSRDLRCVTISNQFGEQQEIVIYDVVGLLVPALKSKPRGLFPQPTTELDHYKIYRVIDGRQVGQPVELEDQFHRRQAMVFYPDLCAVPVRKEHFGEGPSIHNPDTYLTIYRVEHSKDRPDVIDARDQFGLHRYLKMGVSYLLAVPSKKIGWKEC